MPSSRKKGLEKTTNMFALRRLDWKGFFEGKVESRSGLSIHRMVANNNIVIVATTSGMILRMNLAGGVDFDMIEVCQRPEDTIHEIFVDSTGYHLVVGLSNGTNYYVHGHSNKAKLLTKLQCVIESVAFNQRESTESTTKSILVGSSTGQIFEVVIENGRERACQMVYQFEENRAVISIYFETYFTGGGAGSGVGTGGKGSGGRSDMSNTVEYYVICLCSLPTRLYYFQGGPTFQQLFSDYSKTSTFTELPGPYAGRPKLVGLPAQNNQSSSQKFAVMCGVGIYQGSVNCGTRGMGDMSEDSNLMSYPPTSSGGSAMSPISLACTQYHYLLLTEDGKRLLALSSLDGSLVQSYAISHAIGSNAFEFCRDPVKESLWLHTSGEIFQINVVDEDRNVWQMYLTQALRGDEAQFDTALMACPKEKRNIIYTARAEACLVRGDLEGAALSFSLSSLSFEDVVLRLVGATDVHGKPWSGSDAPPEFQVTDSPGLSAVRIYIEEVLSQVLSSDKHSQRTMLCTWACEIYMHQIASVAIRSLPSKWDEETDVILGQISGTSDFSRSRDQAHLQEVERELVASFGEFLRTHKASIDKETTLAMFRSRSKDLEGMKSLLLLFARVTGDYDLAIHELLTTKDRMGSHVESACLQAISILSDARFENVERLIYKYARTLLELQPSRTVQMLVQLPKLNVVKLLPAFLDIVGVADGCKKPSPDEKIKCALHYLKEAISWSCDSGSHLAKEVYHVLIQMYCQYDDEEESELVMFLKPIVTKYQNAAAETRKEHNSSDVKDDNFLETLFSMETKSNSLALVRAREATVPFDVNYILRLCQLYQRRRSVILLNILLSRDVRALEDALSLTNGTDLSSFIIGLPGSEWDRKRRLLTMAKGVISNSAAAEGVKQAITLMRESGGILSVEDLLPFFPDSTEMDLFREDICTLLEQSSDRIKNLREEMTALASTADDVAAELSAIKSRGLVMDNSQNCYYCCRSAFSAQFYLFPCGHVFHTDCIMENMQAHLDSAQLNEAQTLQSALRDIANTNSFHDQRLQRQRDMLREQLDGYIASECPLCGELMIKSIETPLYENNEDQEGTWNLPLN